MPGYEVKQERIAIPGVDDLFIRSLLDRQQFSDPEGDAERLGISSSLWPLFGLLWPSGSHLAQRLGTRRVTQGDRILEIGCGLGLASLVGHRAGADVTASDCHPLAGRFLARNLVLNDLGPMKYRHGQWPGVVLPRDAIDERAPVLVHGEFDLVIGSDVLYERDERGTLADFISALARAGGGGVDRRPQPRQSQRLPQEHGAARLPDGRDPSRPRGTRGNRRLQGKDADLRARLKPARGRCASMSGTPPLESARQTGQTLA